MQKPGRPIGQTIVEVEMANGYAHTVAWGVRSAHIHSLQPCVPLHCPHSKLWPHVVPEASEELTRLPAIEAARPQSLPKHLYLIVLSLRYQPYAATSDLESIVPRPTLVLCAWQVID